MTEFNDGWTNLVLMIGGQILIVILGIMALTFGSNSTFPKNNAERHFGR
jgi:hypothetical protein